jgi:hypothetical protein
VKQALQAGSTAFRFVEERVREIVDAPDAGAAEQAAKRLCMRLATDALKGEAEVSVLQVCHHGTTLDPSNLLQMQWLAENPMDSVFSVLEMLACPDHETAFRRLVRRAMAAPDVPESIFEKIVALHRLCGGRADVVLLLLNPDYCPARVAKLSRLLP